MTILDIKNVNILIKHSSVLNSKLFQVAALGGPLSLWRMASATPDLRLPSRLQSVAALWPAPNYTAWWQRHMGVNNLPRVVTRYSGLAGSRTRDLSITSQRPTHWATHVIEATLERQHCLLVDNSGPGNAYPASRSMSRNAWNWWKDCSIESRTRSSSSRLCWHLSSLSSWRSRWFSMASCTASPTKRRTQRKMHHPPTNRAITKHW